MKPKLDARGGEVLAAFVGAIGANGTIWDVERDPRIDPTAAALGTYSLVFYLASHPEEFVAGVKGADPVAFMRGIQEQVERDKRDGTDPRFRVREPEGLN